MPLSGISTSISAKETYTSANEPCIFAQGLCLSFCTQCSCRPCLEMLSSRLSICISAKEPWMSAKERVIKAFHMYFRKRTLQKSALIYPQKSALIYPGFFCGNTYGKPWGRSFAEIHMESLAAGQVYSLNVPQKSALIHPQISSIYLPMSSMWLFIQTVPIYPHMRPIYLQMHSRDPQKSHAYPQKSHAYPQKSHAYPQKGPYISTKESYVSLYIGL